MQFRALCILPDANVWIRSGLLSDSLGAALSYYCGSMGVRLGLPEVVEREIHRNALRLNRESSGRIRDSYRRLQLFGFSTRIETPTDSDIAHNVTARLAELEPYIERVPFTLEHARSALDRVLDQSPPNSANNQQFKDSAIWEAGLTLCERFAVRFVTADKAFYASQDYARGLADRLLADVTAKKADLVAYSDLDALLVAVQGAATVPGHIEVARRITDGISSEVERLASERGVSITSAIDARLAALPTAQALAVSFRVRFLGSQRSDVESDEPTPIDVTAKGSCTLRIEDGGADIQDISLAEVSFDDGRAPSTILFQTLPEKETTT